jgi:hypothetical protein
MKKLFLTLSLLLVATGANAQYGGGGTGGTPSITEDNTKVTIAKPTTFTTGPILIPDGTAPAPSIAFSTYPTVGISLASSAGFYWIGSGTISGYLHLSGIRLPAASAFSWSSTAGPTASADLSLVRDTAATLQLGVDAATATAQTIKGSDSTGATIAGGDLTVKGGAGTSGIANGGNLLLSGGDKSSTGEPGAVRIVDGGTQPTCAAGIRGAIWYDAGGAGVADSISICAKAAADTYAWRAMATIP